MNENEKDFISDTAQTENTATVDTSEIKRTKPPLKFASVDTAFAWLTLILGFLFARAIPVSTNSLGATLVSIGALIFAAIYLKASSKHVGAKGVIMAVFIGALSLGFITSANKVLHFFLFIFIAALFALWVYTANRLNGGSLFCQNCEAHFIQSLVVIPILSIWYIFPAFLIRERKTVLGKIAQTVIFIIIGLVCAVIPTAVVIAFLSYDKQFTSLLGNIFTFTIWDVLSYIGDGIFGFFIAVVIFAVIFGAKRHSQLSFGEAKKLRPVCTGVIPRALICATVTPVLIVYVIFFISQWDYYLSAFTRVLPEELTYAEYAREGFFQLCWVCGINAVMLLLFNLLIKKNGKERDPLKTIYSTLISLFTLVLIATALSKMLLYIDSFGLTRKRVYASWLIILLALFFIAVLIRQFIRKLPLVPILAVTFAVMFTLISVPDVDSMIASYNVNAYVCGDLDEIDVESLEEYGASAVPALMDLREKLMKKEDPDDDALLARTEWHLSNIRRELDKEERNIFTFNITKERARALLKKAEI